MIVTISRQFAAGGSDVARRVADALGFTLVDYELVSEVARRAGMTPEEVSAREERAPGFADRMARALATSVPEFATPAPDSFEDLPERYLVEITERVVSEMTATGNVVVVGRAAPALLSSRSDALHVRLVAPEAVRLQRAVERLGLSEEEARVRLSNSDLGRARYHRTYYHRDWEDPENYHLTINTAAMGVEGAADLIVEAVRQRFRP